jgi:hypothetical protein
MARACSRTADRSTLVAGVITVSRGDPFRTFMKDAQPVTLTNGRAPTQGSCVVCGTRVTVMGGAKAGQK